MNIMRQHIKLVESTIQAEDIKQAPLGFDTNELWPIMSNHCVDVHYNKLTTKYFTKYAETGDLFQKAGAILHNDYWWPLLQPYEKSNKAPDDVMDLINASHGSFKSFQKSVKEVAMGIQGNGWVLVLQDLQLQPIQNHVLKPGIAMAIDFWEHATVDWDFDREGYLEHFWQIVNWTQFGDNLKGAL